MVSFMGNCDILKFNLPEDNFDALYFIEYCIEYLKNKNYSYESIVKSVIISISESSHRNRYINYYDLNSADLKDLIKKCQYSFEATPILKIFALLDNKIKNIDTAIKIIDEFFEFKTDQSDLIRFAFLRNYFPEEAYNTFISLNGSFSEKINILKLKHTVSLFHPTYNSDEDEEEMQFKRHDDVPSHLQNLICYYHYHFGEKAIRCREPCKIGTKFK